MISQFLITLMNAIIIEQKNSKTIRSVEFKN
jgi:hypothetical protein